MRNAIEKKLIKDCEYCAREVGKERISANILLYVLSLDPQVQSELILNNADTQLLAYLLNPYHLRTQTVRKTTLSDEVKEILAEIESGDSRLDVYKKSLKYKYVREIMAKTGYMEASGQGGIIGKYAKKIDGGVVNKDDMSKYQKINSLLGHKNVMVMGAIGSGRYEFIRSFAKYNKDRFSVFYFDLFKFLKIDEDRLFGIINGVFDELGENFVYIPNFLQTMVWIRSLKLDHIYLLLEDLSRKGKVITKVNKNNFDSQSFHLSEQLQFYSVTLPQITLNNLYDLLGMSARVYEKFYDIAIEKDEIKKIIKESNFKDNSMTQPGKSLKRMMYLALSKYAKDDSLLEKPKEKEHLLEGVYLDKQLKQKIIGQDKPLDELSYEVSKADFIEGGVIGTYLFQGEIGCGKLMTARELSNTLFGTDSLRYIDLSLYAEFPFKLHIYEDVDRIIGSMYGGVIFLDNLEAFDMEELDILTYIRMKIKEVNFEGVMAPVIIIASCRQSITQMQNYKYIIEHFDKIIYFNKLTIRDLEVIAQRQIHKVKYFISPEKELNAFVIGANANPSLNALGVKKLITALSL